MSVDFPRAWQITEKYEKRIHEKKCSYRLDGLLCDCQILTEHPEYLHPTMLFGKDGCVGVSHRYPIYPPPEIPEWFPKIKKDAQSKDTETDK